MKFIKYFRLFLGAFNCFLLGKLVEREAPPLFIGISIAMVLFFFVFFVIENERDIKRLTDVNPNPNEGIINNDPIRI